jgi:hypothetical protein
MSDHPKRPASFDTKVIVVAWALATLALINAAFVAGRLTAANCATSHSLPAAISKLGVGGGIGGR